MEAVRARLLLLALTVLPFVSVWAFFYFYLEIRSMNEMVDALAKLPVTVAEKIVNLTTHFVRSFTMRLSGAMSGIFS